MSAILVRQNSANAIVRGWTRLYTAGTPAGAKERRRIQIESDLWEEAAEASAAGLPQGLLFVNIVGRMIRGMPADILWRTRYGGPNVNLSISLPRATGLLLLILAVAAVAGTSIQGYDTSRDSWPSEFQRLGEQGETTNHLTTAFFFVIGFAMIGVATLLGVLLIPKSRILASLAAAFLGAAGVAITISAALYGAISSEAAEFAAGKAPATAIAEARILVIVLDGMMIAAAAALAPACYALAAVLLRTNLAPRWSAAFPLLSGLSFTALAVVEVGRFSGYAAWGLFMGTLLPLSGWLIVVGFKLLLSDALSGPAKAPATA